MKVSRLPPTRGRCSAQPHRQKPLWEQDRAPWVCPREVLRLGSVGNSCGDFGERSANPRSARTLARPGRGQNSGWRCGSCLRAEGACLAPKARLRGAALLLRPYTPLCHTSPVPGGPQTQTRFSEGQWWPQPRSQLMVATGLGPRLGGGQCLRFAASWRWRSAGSSS